MNPGSLVFVTRDSQEFEQTLDALEDCRGELTLCHTAAEAHEKLKEDRLSARSGTRLAGLVLDADFLALDEVQALVTEVRAFPESMLLPIVLWGGSEAISVLLRECGDEVTSTVVAPPGKFDRALALTHLTHYWIAVNHGPGLIRAVSGGP